MRAVLALLVIAFLGGALMVGWLVRDGRIAVSGANSLPMPVAQPSLAAAPAPRPSVASAQAATTAGFEARVASLEARLARLDSQTAAAEGNNARAEAMMIAFATRRAVERGVPLGFLSEQLKLRFGDAQPTAVATVLDAASAPVTLDKLLADLDALAPRLAQAPQHEGGWDRISRELSSLFVIRRDSAPSTRPLERLERARLLLRTGQTDAAMAEVERLPGNANAAGWLATARRYAETERALDQLETAALLEPERLRAGNGSALRQPSPAASSPLADNGSPSWQPF